MTMYFVQTPKANQILKTCYSLAILTVVVASCCCLANSDTPSAPVPVTGITQPARAPNQQQQHQNNRRQAPDTQATERAIGGGEVLEERHASPARSALDHSPETQFKPTTNPNNINNNNNNYDNNNIKLIINDPNAGAKSLDEEEDKKYVRNDKEKNQLKKKKEKKENEKQSLAGQLQRPQKSASIKMTARRKQLAMETSQLDDRAAWPLSSLASPIIKPTKLTPSATFSQSSSSNSNQQHASYMAHDTEQPMPVLLIMRDYIVNFFSCIECSRNFRLEAADLNFKRISQQEPAEFSVLWLWETHNSVSKRLATQFNFPDHTKRWFPSYKQCSKCYKEPPSLETGTTFHESIDWNLAEVLNFLQREYTKHPSSCIQT
uniref:Sulfhydryl oxidase n=1 Tax=Aceria tosichella TaxID=561515 RepID=A0A6G1SC88_9ACAR